MTNPITNERLRELADGTHAVVGPEAADLARDVLALRAVVRRLLANAPYTGGHCGWCDGCDECNDGCEARDCVGSDAIALLPDEDVVSAGE